MKFKKEKIQSIYHNQIGFWKANWALLVLIILAIIVISALGYMVLSPYKNKKSIEEDIANMQITNLISVDKIVCYSSAYGINNSETQARWNLNLSQYTDIAIYLNVQTSIKSIYIDNISYTNLSTGDLSLSYLATENFGKSPIAELESSTQENEKDEIDLTLPITFRYLNNNLKENCLISDIETPLSFDGSILKRGKITLSSLKNTVYFTLHIVDSSDQEFVYPFSISIVLENSETGESIYDGSYTHEFTFSNAYFYCT